MALRSTIGVAAALVVLFSSNPAAAQSAQPADMSALLAEVKALRAEINEVAGASMRMQLLVARLSLQEQRLAELSRQVLDAQKSHDEVVRQRADLQEQAKRIDEGLLDARLIPEARQAMAEVRESTRREAALSQPREAELLARLQDLQAQVAAEQGRWADFNNRLDELERALPNKR